MIQHSTFTEFGQRFSRNDVCQVFSFLYKNNNITVILLEKINFFSLSFKETMQVHATILKVEGPMILKLLVLSESTKRENFSLNFTALEWLKTLCFTLKNFCGSSYEHLFICFEIAFHCVGFWAIYFMAHIQSFLQSSASRKNLPKTFFLDAFRQQIL